MPQASYSVVVHRPIEEVFAFVADGERCPEWRPGVLDIKRVAGTGLGTRYEQGVRGPGGRRISADYEVTVFEPNARIEFQTTSGPVRPHGSYRFEVTDAGTNVNFALDATLSGLRGMLMRSPVQRTMDSEVRTLDNLKRVLEG